MEERSKGAQPRVIRLGFLGLGNVGSGVYRVLQENGAAYLHRENLDIRVKRILVRDVQKQRDVAVDPKLLTERLEDVIDDADIDIVVEFMGGEEPALSHLLAALSRGKTVVTANKEVVAKHWDVLEQKARAHHAGLYFEASVAGGIPILRTLWDSLQGNEIDSVIGIINGTTNYILTKMSEEGKTYGEVLQEAQRLGLAEPDPTADVEGFDAMYKLSILSSIAFDAHVPLEKIYREGISHITPEDILYASELGLVPKLLAIGKKRGGAIEARVHPTLIPKEHPLASVRDAYNAIFLHGNAVDNLMFYGRGAGAYPTASAILGDVIHAAHTLAQPRYMRFNDPKERGEEVRFEDDWMTECFIHTQVQDKPGVLAKIAGILGAHGVSLASVFQISHGQGEVPLIFVTHKASEKALQDAVKELGMLPDVVRVANMIRVEGT